MYKNLITKVRRKNLARFLVLIMFATLTNFVGNGASLNAYQYPTSAKQKTQTKIFIPVNSAKKVAQFSSRSRINAASNFTFGGSNAITQNSAVCGEYTVNQPETITISIVGYGSIGAIAPRTGDSTPITFPIIATNPSTTTFSYVIRNGDCPSFQFTPATGYNFSSYSLDGGPNSNSNTLTLSRVLSTHSLEVTFTKQQFDLQYYAGVGGSLSGAGNTATDSITATVNYLENGPTITANPNPDFRFVNWSDGISDVTRTDNSVTQGLTLTANFVHNPVVTATAGPHGSISPVGATTVNYGSAASFTIAPDNNFHIEDVLVDGNSVGAVTSYTFANLTVNHTISVTFAIDTFTVTYTAGTHGQIDGHSSVSQTVAFGSNGAPVTAVADSGYHFLKWSDNSTNPTRSASNVIADSAFTATFEANPSGGGGGGVAPVQIYKIIYSSGGGLGNPPAAPNTYTIGTNFNLPLNTFTKGGYDFVGWTELISKKLYKEKETYNALQGDVQFTATWEKHKYVITYLPGDKATGIGPSEPLSFIFGDSFEAPECKSNCFALEGYVFNGWSDGSILYKSGDKFETRNADVTLTATWILDTTAIVITPGTPKVAIKTLGRYTLTAVKYGSVKANFSIKDVTSRTYNLAIKHDTGSSIRLLDSVIHSVDGKLVFAISDAGVMITALNGWTGKITVPVIAVQNNKEIEKFIAITEVPGVVLKPLINVKNLSKEVISWKKDGSQVIGYVVTNGKKVICKTTKLTCVVNNGTQGTLNIKIQALGHDSTLSALVKPGVTPNSFVVQFASGSYAISGQYKTVLNNLIRIAKLVNATKFIVTGHTDSDGNVALNQVLSENRAKAVEKYLSNSIKRATYTVNGLAATIPVADNSTASGKAVNRRVEIKIG